MCGSSNLPRLVYWVFSSYIAKVLLLIVSLDYLIQEAVDLNGVYYFKAHYMFSAQLLALMYFDRQILHYFVLYFTHIL